MQNEWIPFWNNLAQLWKNYNKMSIPATAFASRVFPHPGGPWSNMPLAGVIPMCLYISGCLRWMRSLQIWSRTFSRPPSWAKVILDSWTSNSGSLLWAENNNKALLTFFYQLIRSFNSPTISDGKIFSWHWKGLLWSEHSFKFYCNTVIKFLLATGSFWGLIPDADSDFLIDAVTGEEARLDFRFDFPKVVFALSSLTTFWSPFVRSTMFLGLITTGEWSFIVSFNTTSFSDVLLVSSFVVELASPVLEASLMPSGVFDLFPISSSLVFTCSSPFIFLAFVLSSGLRFIWNL